MIKIQVYDNYRLQYFEQIWRLWLQFNYISNVLIS